MSSKTKPKVALIPRETRAERRERRLADLKQSIRQGHRGK